jgi:hypothetical protein
MMTWHFDNFLTWNKNLKKEKKGQKSLNMKIVGSMATVS